MFFPLTSASDERNLRRSRKRELLVVVVVVALSFRRRLFAVRVDSVRRHVQHEGQKKSRPNGLAPLSPKRVTLLETVARILAGIGGGRCEGGIKVNI